MRDIGSEVCKNMRTQLSPLFEATRQVAEQNLGFEVGHSKIKEFEDVLCSFANMKDNLKISLEKQWNAEQLQRTDCSTRSRFENTSDRHSRKY